MKRTALDLVFAARTTVLALREFAKTHEMTPLPSLVTDDAVSDLYAAGDHGVEIAVIIGAPVEGSVAVTFNFVSEGDSVAAIIADTRIGSGRWSFQLRIEEDQEECTIAQQAVAIATAMGIEGDEIKVVESDDEALNLINVPATRMLELADEERGAAVG